MTLLAVGLSHRTAPVSVLERVTVGADELVKTIHDLAACADVSEVLLLPTCNRVEVYAAVETFHGGLSAVTGVLARHAGMPVTELARHLYVHYAGAAVEHIFSVAAGLDSMVVGEAQILGQLRSCYAAAEAEQTIGSTLHEVIQQALRVGKLVHTDTEIDRAGGSVVSEGLTDAVAVLGELTGRTALVVGAGSMGGLAAAALRRAGVGRIVFASRTRANAERLAEAVAGEGTPATAVELSGIREQLAAADLLIACTGSTVPTVTIDDIRARRSTKPLVICDLGLPRDVEAAAADLPGVSMVDLTTLQARLTDAPTGRDVAKAGELVTAEVARYLAGQRSASVTPTVTALRRRAAEVVDAELSRLDSRLPTVDDHVRGELARTVRRVVDKLLHTPTVRVKELASGPGGTTYAEALRELFELDPTLPAVVSESAGGRLDTGPRDTAKFDDESRAGGAPVDGTVE